MRKIQLQTSICWHRRAKLKRFSESLPVKTTAMKFEQKFISEEVDQIEENLLNYIKGGNSSIDSEDSSDCCGLQFSCNHRGKKEAKGQDVIQFS